MSGVVRYEVVDHVAVVTLDRPEALNAFTDEMEAGIVEAFDRSDVDPEVRVVVMTGTGRAFCAGMDLSEAPPDETFERWRSSGTAPAGTQYDVPGETLPLRRDGGGRVVLRVFESRHPVIAAVNGHAIGVGLTMTLPADVRLLAAGAKLAMPFTRRAFVPESCSSWFLPRIVGISRALDWMLSGRTIDPGEAVEAGLFRAVLPEADLLPAAMETARTFVDGTSPVSMTLSRRMLWHMLTVSHPMEAHRLETLALNERGTSGDAHEGVAAFTERRTPDFGTSTTTTEERLLDAMASPRFEPPEGATPR